MITSYRSQRIVTESEVIDGWLSIDGERIFAIEQEPSGIIDMTYQDDWLFPGLIDPHLHGFMGWNASKTTDEQEILHMADALLWAGITSCVPSCISTSFITENVKAIHKAKLLQKHGARILGAYMEGPFYAPAYNGGTPISYFQKPSLEKAMEFYVAAGNDLLSIGIAPELPGALEVISFFAKKGVRVGIAHTGATYAQTMEAIRAGCQMATHSFNAMRSIHHREVGVAGAILLDKSLYNEINCDFIHVCPQMIEILLQMKPHERILMMTDSDSMTGMLPGAYQIDGRIEILEPDGKIHLSDGTIYGSGKLLLEDIFHLIEELHVPVADAVAMASLHAATFLGVANDIGSLTAGKLADFIAIDDRHRCIATFQDGKQVCSYEQQAALANPRFMEKRVR